MRNPLRSEAEAFRFLLLTIGYFALIAIGALIDKWVGVGVFIVLSLVVLYVAFLRETSLRRASRRRFSTTQASGASS